MKLGLLEEIFAAAPPTNQPEALLTKISTEMPKPAPPGFKSGADISRSYHSPMSFGISIEEEVQITVGDVKYILILHQEVVIAVRSQHSPLTASELLQL